jgi:hypothetical protein
LASWCGCGLPVRLATVGVVAFDAKPFHSGEGTSGWRLLARGSMPWRSMRFWRHVGNCDYRGRTLPEDEGCECYTTEPGAGSSPEPEIGVPCFLARARHLDPAGSFGKVPPGEKAHAYWGMARLAA